MCLRARGIVWYQQFLFLLFFFTKILVRALVAPMTDEIASCILKVQFTKILVCPVRALVAPMSADSDEIGSFERGSMEQRGRPMRACPP